MQEEGIVINLEGIKEDNEEIKSFRTYSNYLLSLKQYIEYKYGKRPEVFVNLKTACEEKPSYSKFQTNKDADLDKIKKLLFNSWHTEIVFCIPRKTSEEFVKYSNHWAPIQAYYSIFLSIRALFDSMGIVCPHSHADTLQQISESIVNRDLFPSPWNSYCRGQKELNNHSYFNFLGEYKEISNLSTPFLVDFWSWYALWLKTTRERKDKKRRKEAIKSKRFKCANGEPRKNLSFKQKLIVDSTLHATTFYDGLYRLRIRSNYEDADAFILGTMSQEEALTFYDSLIVILEATLFVLEKCISKHISSQEYKNIVDEFIRSVGEDMAKDTVALRKDYY
ncbi:MAG: hypothetical protein WC317_07835 [Candidatus Omnitrophota bacterium]|jgi:hypothetical protein